MDAIRFSVSFFICALFAMVAVFLQITMIGSDPNAIGYIFAEIVKRSVISLAVSCTAYLFVRLIFKKRMIVSFLFVALFALFSVINIVSIMRVDHETNFLVESKSIVSKKSIVFVDDPYKIKSRYSLYLYGYYTTFLDVANHFTSLFYQIDKDLAELFQDFDDQLGVGWINAIDRKNLFQKLNPLRQKLIEVQKINNAENEIAYNFFKRKHLENDEEVQLFLKRLEENRSFSSSKFNSFIDLHVVYSNVFVDFLNLLDNNSDYFRLEGEELLFDDSFDRNGFDEHLETLMDLEEKIEEMRRVAIIAEKNDGELFSGIIDAALQQLK